jgi:hypothetical protein
MTQTIQFLIKDCKGARKRLLESPLATSAQASSEMANNMYPLLEAILKEIAEVDDVIQEVIDQTESFVQEDLAEAIYAALTAGGQLVSQVAELLSSGDLDDLRKRKLADAAAVYEALAAAAVAAVHDASSDSDDDSDDDDSDDDSNDDSDDTAIEAEGEEQ